MKKNTSSLYVLFYFICLCLVVELVGGWLTNLSVHDWYPMLKKPSWTPPNWLFGPVWTSLYLLMAFSAWLIWKTPENEKQLSKISKKSAFTLFYTQLFLNLVWSGLFFSMRNPLLGLIDISILYLFICLTIYSFYLIRPLAAYLLIPYLFWVSYATALNFAIWKLN